MKSLTIIIYTEDQQELTHQLRNFEQIKGFSLSHIEGHGIEGEHDAFLAARDQVVGSSPRVRADILLQEDDLDLVLQTLKSAKESGKLKRVYYWVTAIEQEGHL